MCTVLSRSGGQNLHFVISRVRMGEMTTFSTQLPSQRPTVDVGDFEAKMAPKLEFAHPMDREDAMQEAWLAKLEGRNPTRAINTFVVREWRHRLNERTGILQQY